MLTLTLDKDTKFTPFANRLGVKVILATPIEDERWSIVAMRTKNVMGKVVTEYVAWEWQEGTVSPYNGCYFMQNADEFSDESAFHNAVGVHTDRVERSQELAVKRARQLALDYINDG
jgi:hypothetical protein